MFLWNCDAILNGWLWQFGVLDYNCSSVHTLSCKLRAYQCSDNNIIIMLTTLAYYSKGFHFSTFTYGCNERNEVTLMFYRSDSYDNNYHSRVQYQEIPCIWVHCLMFSQIHKISKRYWRQWMSDWKHLQPSNASKSCQSAGCFVVVFELLLVSPV